MDQILNGGFLPNKSYLLRGGPGTGKSTFGYRFLEQGAQSGEKSLLITLGESKENVLENSSTLGIDFSDVDILDLSPQDQLYREASSYTVFPSSDVETGPLVEEVIKMVDRVQPERVLLDSITMLKYLNQDPFQYRNLVLSFIKYICSSGATLLIISETNIQSEDEEATYWVDGIINLIYSPEWRRLNVLKFRGSSFQTGNHAFKISEHGLEVFPKLRPDQYDRTFISDPLSTGIEGLDSMLKGGIEKGTITILTGPTGVGKTNMGLQIMKQAASRGERSVIYTFEESNDVLIKRSKKIGIPIDDMIENDNLVIKSIQPFSYSPDEFSNLVTTEIEQNNTEIVMIDTVGAYTLSVRDENYLERLHSLCIYMGNMGVTGFLLNETKSVAGEFETTNLNASFLADNIIFIRYLEINGELRKAIGVLKKRLSDFEKTIREFKITHNGLHIGSPMKNIRGIMTGIPEVNDNF